LKLQQSNLLESIEKGEMETQGFVTAKHDIELLSLMNHPYPHITAKENEKLIGYALVMLKNFEKSIQILVPMFEQINSIIYQGELLKNANYFVMGQICIEKNYRGEGIFKRLYEKLRDQMAEDFKYVITEVSKRNARSTSAHLKMGFINIKEYRSTIDNEEWIIFLWDWN
jgi:predicted GNAT superfamily acetyltransferase